MRHTLALAGWLLVGYYGATVPTIYRTEKDCQIAAQYGKSLDIHCIPDATEIESWQGKQ